MTTLIFQRATWRLQMSRTSRLFSVSFTTGLPRSGRLRRLPAELPEPIGSTSNPLGNKERPSAGTSARYTEARRAYTTSKIYQAQPAEPKTPASKDHPQPPDQGPETISAEIPDLSNGLNDGNLVLDEGDKQVDWSRSFHGLSTEAFSPEAAKTLLAPIPVEDIEVKPDGIIYLPEIKYRRILNQAFGPGGWGLAPRGETIVTAKAVTREYALVALGRLVSVARGEQDYFSPEGIPSAVEGCKSTALRRCCKDLGIASELWDPSFIRKFMSQHAKEVFVEHAVTKKKRKHYMRKDDTLRYPWKESKYGA